MKLDEVLDGYSLLICCPVVGLGDLLLKCADQEPWQLKSKSLPTQQIV